MSISTNYGSGAYDPSVYDLVKHDLSEIEKKGGVAKLETLSDLRLSGDKLVMSEDALKLMEKYDKDSFATYSQIAKTEDGEYSKEGIEFLDKWINDVKKGNIVENNYDNKLWKKYDISDDKSRSGIAKVDTLADLRNAKETSYLSEDIANLMKKYDKNAYKTYSSIATTPDGKVNPGGIQFLNKWVNAVKNGFIKENDSASNARTNDISAKNEEKLSKKAQDFLKNLRSKYGDYDFMIGNGSDELKALSKSGSKEYSVIFSSAEIERMANDEKYAADKMKGVEGAVKMCKRICEENGYVSAFDKGQGANGVVNKIGVSVDDNGNMKLFADLEKTSAKQKERIEKNREKHAEEKKAAEKHAHKMNPYEKDEKTSIKRTTIEASSEEELLKKIKEFDWAKVKDSHSGDRFNFTA